jgi:hypothetical protein
MGQTAVFDTATNLITMLGGRLRRARSISAIELRVTADFASPFVAEKSVPEPALPSVRNRT